VTGRGERRHVRSSTSTWEGRVRRDDEAARVKTVAIGIVCKTPIAGRSKTRLSPPLRPEDCAGLSACFIRDLSATIATLPADRITGYAIYTPIGSEAALRRLLPPGLRLLPQCAGDLGARLEQATVDLLGAGHAGAILVNSDSPTLPAAILAAAAQALRGDAVVLSRAFDGGYTLIGLTRPHRRLFADIPWSTPEVYRLTRERADEIGLAVLDVPAWYDVDDAASLGLLESELAGTPLPFAPHLEGAEAPATRAFLTRRTAPRRAGSSR
jgi:uncharacterized protein